jgi:hypothetical protein
MALDRLTEDAFERLAKALHEAFQPKRAEVLAALRGVATFNPGDVPIQFDPKSGCSVYGKTTRADVVKELEEDARAPFMTEAYLYNLLGKEDARTLLARFGVLCRVLGVEPADLFGEEA